MFLLDGLFERFVEQCLVAAPASALFEMLNNLPIEIDVDPLLER